MIGIILGSASAAVFFIVAIGLMVMLRPKGGWSKRDVRWGVRYCHHDQPCWCGGKYDPHWHYEWSM